MKNQRKKKKWRRRNKKRLKKSVSFTLKPEIKTYDNSQGRSTKVVRKTVKKVVQVRRKNDEKDQTELEIVDVGAMESSDVTSHDNVTLEKLKISEEGIDNKNIR